MSHHVVAVSSVWLTLNSLIIVFGVRVGVRHAFCFHWDLQVVCALITSSCLPNGKCRDYELVYGSAGMLGVKKQTVWYEMKRSFALYV
jgi:hypothetical protein